jgi:hypothetical protein
LLLISNVVFFTIFQVNQKSRISELQKLYSIKRNSQTLEKDSKQERYIKAKDDVNLFKGALQEKKDFAETAAELFMILNKHQLNIGQIIYKPESIDFNGLYKYTTSLVIKGSYFSIKSMLADLQESKKLFCIEELSISNIAGENAVEMKIKISTYFR